MGVDDAQEQTRPLYVMWWSPRRGVRFTTEEEVLWLYSQGKITREGYRECARFFALRQRYGGRVRRHPDGYTEVQERVPFGRGPGPVILCSLETPASATVSRRTT